MAGKLRPPPTCSRRASAHGSLKTSRRKSACTSWRAPSCRMPGERPLLAPTRSGCGGRTGRGLSRGRPPVCTGPGCWELAGGRGALHWKCGECRWPVHGQCLALPLAWSVMGLGTGRRSPGKAHSPDPSGGRRSRSLDRPTPPRGPPCHCCLSSREPVGPAGLPSGARMSRVSLRDTTRPRSRDREPRWHGRWSYCFGGTSANDVT